MKTLKGMILISILTMGTTFSATGSAASLDELNSQWVNSFDKGNTDKLMTLYTDTAMVFPPSSEILEGTTAISAYLDSLRKVGFNEYSISNVGLQIKGDTAYSTALWEATRIGANGSEIKLDGNITNVLERQEDGNWKIKLQSWN